MIKVDYLIQFFFSLKFRVISEFMFVIYSNGPSLYHRKSSDNRDLRTVPSIFVPRRVDFFHLQIFFLLFSLYLLNQRHSGKIKGEENWKVHIFYGGDEATFLISDLLLCSQKGSLFSISLHFTGLHRLRRSPLRRGLQLHRRTRFRIGRPPNR